MPSKAAKKARRRQSVDRSERVGPTPETAAKLKPDPFNLMVERGYLDTAQRDAGLEIRSIYMAVVGALMPRGGDLSSARSGSGMPTVLAAAHAQRYVPWCQRWNRGVEMVIGLVVDAEPPMSGQAVSIMLTDYAKRMRAPLDLQEAA